MLLDRLAFEDSRNAKLRLLTDYFRNTPDPDRGYALAAITGALSFRHAKPGLIRALIADRTDPALFEMSYDYVGDLSETVSLMWPARHLSQSVEALLTLSEVVTTLQTLGKTELPARLAHWLDLLDETGRWALLKLITGAMRIGVSARLAKTAVAALGRLDANDIEIAWPSSRPPYGDLFAWVEGRAGRPAGGDPAPFHPPMLSHAIEEAEFAALDPAAFLAEWKWDGIRVQAVAGSIAEGRRVARLYSRTGEDISASFPDLVDALGFDGAVDGELLIVRDGRVQSFNVLQQRLNRKTVTPKLLAEFPAHVRAYDLLVEGATDLRDEAFAARRARLEALVASHGGERSRCRRWCRCQLGRARGGAGRSGGRRGRPRCGGDRRRDDQAPRFALFAGTAKRHVVEMEARPVHHRCRADVCSARTWQTFLLLLGLYVRRVDGGRFGRTIGAGREGLFRVHRCGTRRVDRYVRANTVNRFGPIREVIHERDRGLVFEVAFEGLQKSTRHKSGVAMRFPRISRLRWDKQPRDADRLETLEALLGRRAAPAQADREPKRRSSADAPGAFDLVNRTVVK